MSEGGRIILPDNPLYALTLNGTLPPDWGMRADELGHFPNFVCDAGTGLMRPASHVEMLDYVYGGEYDERLENMDDYDIEVVEL